MNSTVPDPSDTRRRRLLIYASIGGVVLLALICVGIYGLLRGPAKQPDSVPQVSAASNDERLAPYEVWSTRDPERFTEAIAEGLFNWDSALGNPLAAYQQPLIDAASEEEAVAFASDVRSYYPSESEWRELRRMNVRQWLAIDQITVPESWSTAVRQTRPDQLPDGAAALTVTGVRHRAGVWGAEPATFEEQVSFTVFVACPGTENCRVLRLSILDQPLE